VSLQQTAEGNYIPVTTTPGDDSDSDNKPQKICKTEQSVASPASNSSTSNNAASGVSGQAIVTQIVVARDGKDNKMTSLGMGMVSVAAANFKLRVVSISYNYIYKYT